MREELYKSYSLSGTDLALLLAGKGCNEVCSIPFINGSEGREQYLYSIERMSKNGIIIPTGSEFLINEPYSRFIEHIVNSHTVVLLRSGMGTSLDQCLYYDTNTNDIAVVCRSAHNKNRVLLTMISSDKFLREYADAVYLPDIFAGTEEPQNEDLSEVAIRILNGLKNGEVLDDVRFLLGAYVVSRDKKREQSILVLHLPRGVYLLTYDEIGSNSEIYTPEAFLQKLYDMTGGMRLK